MTAQPSIHWPAIDAALDFHSSIERLRTMPGMSRTDLDRIRREMLLLTDMPAKGHSIEVPE